MKILKLSTQKNMEDTCKEIEKMIPCVLGTKTNKMREGKSVVYYPARRFMGTDDLMDDVRIVVRKVNNSLTSIKLENSERLANPKPLIKEMFGDNWRLPAIEKAYKTLSNVLSQMFPKEKINGEESEDEQSED